MKTFGRSLIQVGEIIESAVWITGDESELMRKRFELDVEASMNELCEYHSVVHGPLSWVEKRPGEPRVPPVPDHIQGQRVRLLVAEATIIRKEVRKKPGSFIAELDIKDLQILRKKTKDAFARQFKRKTPLEDWQADEIIEALGPEVVLDELRRG